MYNIYTAGLIRPLPSKIFILTEVENEMEDLSISVYRSRAVFSPLTNKNLILLVILARSKL